jgi:hypothetical protein
MKWATRTFGRRLLDASHRGRPRGGVAMAREYENSNYSTHPIDKKTGIFLFEEATVVFSEEKSDAREKRRDAGEAIHRSVGASREADWID